MKFITKICPCCTELFTEYQGFEWEGVEYCSYDCVAFVIDKQEDESNWNNNLNLGDDE